MKDKTDLLKAKLYVDNVLPVDDKEHHHVPFDESMVILDDTIVFSRMLIYISMAEFYLIEYTRLTFKINSRKSLPRRTLRCEITTLCSKMLKIIPISCQWITIKSIEKERRRR